MNKLTKVLTMLLFLLLAVGSSPTGVYAVCPVCTVAVAGGLGLSRYFGIDDSISGVWIGGLILSTSFWLIDWSGKKYKTKIDKYLGPIVKKIGFTNLNQSVSLIVIILMYLLTLLPLFYMGTIGHPLNTILGIDKILFGTLIGSLVFLLGKWLDKKIREKYGKQLFVYQKVVFPVATLIIASLLLFYFGGYLYKI